MATFLKEMYRNFPGVPEEHHINLPGDIRTGHGPIQVTSIIVEATLTG
jgi:hypothetical protein